MQDRLRFSLNSEQCELLLAFENAGSLADLAKMMHKDASVISRNLQGLADSGVIEKSGNRWVLTATGRQVNHWTRTAATSQNRILEQQNRLRILDSKLPTIDQNTALIVIGVQWGFDDPEWGARNNLGADEAIENLLQSWRAAKRPVYHVQHQSKQPTSPLRQGTKGSQFKDFVEPLKHELIVGKSNNSAFAKTNFEALLRENGHEVLVMVGYSSNHCVDATARAAGDLGFSVFVVEDCCVAFDRVDPHGKIVKADEIQRVIMANLNQEFATVVESAQLVGRSGIIG